MKGATLLAEILDRDFCSSLPAGRVEKDLAAAYYNWFQELRMMQGET